MKYIDPDHPTVVSSGLNIISDPQIHFQKSQKGFDDHRRPENINYTIVKYATL